MNRTYNERYMIPEQFRKRYHYPPFYECLYRNNQGWLIKGATKPQLLTLLAFLDKLGVRNNDVARRLGWTEERG